MVELRKFQQFWRLPSSEVDNGQKTGTELSPNFTHSLIFRLAAGWPRGVLAEQDLDWITVFLRGGWGIPGLDH
jgi:hypothetical protein